MHSWKGAGGAPESLGCLYVDRTATDAHTGAKVFYNTCVRVRPCAFAYSCAHAIPCLCASHTQRRSLPLWRRYTRAVCARTDVLFLREKQTRIPFLMRTGAKVFYNVGKDTRAYIRFAIKRILTYRAILFARTEPVALAARCWSPLTFSFCKSFVDPRIYLPCWIHVNFLYETYAETRIAMTVIPRAVLFPRGRNIFYVCEGTFYTPVEDRISFLV